MAKLKPCPLCGGCSSRGVRKITEKYYEVQAHCEICGCEIKHKISFGPWVKDPEREAKKRISALWNRRVNDGKAD